MTSTSRQSTSSTELAANCSGLAAVRDVWHVHKTRWRGVDHGSNEELVRRSHRLTNRPTNSHRGRAQYATRDIHTVAICLLTAAPVVAADDDDRPRFSRGANSSMSSAPSRMPESSAARPPTPLLLPPPPWPALPCSDHAVLRPLIAVCSSSSKRSH